MVLDNLAVHFMNKFSLLEASNILASLFNPGLNVIRNLDHAFGPFRYTCLGEPLELAAGSNLPGIGSM